MNWLKIVGIVLIVMAGMGMLSIISDYLTGKLEFWPFGTEIGTGLVIWLGIFLIRRGNNQQKNKLML